MKNISQDQLGKRIVLLTLGFIAIIATFSIWITEANSKDQARFRRVSAAVHEEARDIVAKDATWTVTSLDTASLGDAYVVKLRITDGKTIVKLNRHRWQTYLGWNDLSVGSRVSLRCNDRIKSLLLSDHLIVSVDERQTL